jgi:hypothetical protein
LGATIKNLLAIFICLNLLGTHALASTVETGAELDTELVSDIYLNEDLLDERTKVADRFHQRAGRVTCQFVDSEIRKIRLKKREQINAEIQNSIDAIEVSIESLKKLKTKASRRKIKEHRAVVVKFKTMKKDPSLAINLVKGLESICLAMSRPAVELVKAGSMLNSVAFNSVALPIVSTYKFFRALGTGSVKTQGNSILYAALGPQNSAVPYALSSIAGLGVGVLLNSSPISLAMSGSFTVEMLLNYHCENNNLYNQSDKKFCDDYHALRDAYSQMSSDAEAAGLKLRKLIDKGIIKHHGDKISKKLCTKNELAQTRYAKRVYERSSELIKQEIIEKFEIELEAFTIILPDSKNKCVKFLISPQISANPTEQDLAQFESEKRKLHEWGRVAIEGIKLLIGSTREVEFSYDNADGEKSTSTETHIYYGNAQGDEEVQLEKDHASDFFDLSREEQFCGQFRRLKQQRIFQNKLFLLEQSLTVMLAPQYVAKPEIHKIIIPDENVYKANLKLDKKLKGLRNIILSVGHTESKKREFQELGGKSFIKKQRKQLRLELKGLVPRIRKLQRISKIGNYQKCVEKLNAIEFDLEEYIEEVKDYSNRKNEFKKSPLVTQLAEHGVVKSQFMISKIHLSLKWELIETNSIFELDRLLKSGDIGNIIIISHGRDDGHLVDSDKNELPTKFFSQISPSIASINFYSCHSQHINKLYKIVEKLKSTPSFHKLRSFTNVAYNNLLNGDEYAPISAFGHYLVKLDKYLKNGNAGTYLFQEVFSESLEPFKIPKKCSLNTSDIHVTNGAFGIVLNGNYIGAIGMTSESGLIEYDCSYLKLEKNKLTIQSLGLRKYSQSKGQIENSNDFNITINGRVLSIAKDGKNYSDSIYIFKF